MENTILIRNEVTIEIFSQYFNLIMFFYIAVIHYLNISVHIQVTMTYFLFHVSADLLLSFKANPQSTNAVCNGDVPPGLKLPAQKILIHSLLPESFVSEQ